MSTYGPTTIQQGGRGLCAFTNPELVDMKPGGATIDWTKVLTTGDGTTDIGGGVIVPSGVKYIRYGQVLRKITATGKFAPVDTTGSGGNELVTAVSGDVFISARTHLQSALHSDHLADVADNGAVFTNRLLVTGTGAPTLANIRTMFPGVSFIS